MKRILGLILCFGILISGFVGCGQKSKEEALKDEYNKSYQKVQDLKKSMPKEEYNKVVESVGKQLDAKYKN